LKPSKKHIKGYSPEAMALICGIPAETIREVAREFATTKSAHDFVGYGREPTRAWNR
jgi:formate dehydrogenase major subunit